MSREALLRHQHAITAARRRRVEGTASFRLQNAPLVDINMPVAVRVHRRERGLEAHRHEEILQVFIPAVNEK